LGGIMTSQGHRPTRAWRRGWLPGTVALVLGMAAVRPAAGQLRPSSPYRTLESAHFRVTYPPELESLARRAAGTAESTRDFLVAQLSVPPAGKVDIVLTDDVDFSNGFANAFPSNRVVVYARPPIDEEALSYNTDWIDLVVSHELTHIFHLDRSGGVGRAMRAVFGRLPLVWPMFPAVSTPRWSTEGLAVDIESAYTGQGRLHGTNHEMVVRTAVLEGDIDRMDRLNESSPIWPGDQRAYIYGSLFMEYLSERYGEEVQRRLLNNTANAFLPPVFFFDQVARRTFGESFDDAFAAWRADLERRYTRLADSLRATRLTESERLTTHPRRAMLPRVSADGRLLAYAAEDGRSVSATRVIDLATGRVLASHRRNGLGATSWLPDGGLLVSQLEFRGPYRIFSDLWTLGAGGRRLTHGARVQDPDAARDGERIVAVQNGAGVTRLVLSRRSTGEVRPITPADPAVLWASPRWSPAGDRIAAARWRQGGEYDIVVVDTTGTVIAVVASGRDLNQTPAWSPDGRWLLFSSDRTGIANLYAADLTAAGGASLRQVTHVLTGAFQPDVSPDGRWIYFSGYHAQGYAIERMPFDPSTWRDAPPARVTEAVATRGDGGVTAQADVVQHAGSYSPWRSLAPHYWQPTLYAVGAAGTFVGALTSGQDLVGRHAFSANLAFDVEGSGRWEGFVGYRNARLGNPVLSLEASRTWDDLGRAVINDSTRVDRLERDDFLAALLTLTHRRWRNAASVSLGIERENLQRSVEGNDRVRFRDPDDDYVNLIARASFSTTRTPVFAVSREDGLALALSARRAAEQSSSVFHDSTGAAFPRDYREVRGVVTAYQSLPLPGFAHHALALRLAAHWSDGPGAKLEGVGGSSGGGGASLLGYGFTSGSRLLPVRGFEARTLAGTRAWSASAEWRVPLALPGRRPALSPFFVDRIGAAAFVDAGDATCTSAERALSLTCRNAAATASPLLGAGGELFLDLAFAGVIAARARAGVGAPLRGPREGVRFYFEIGSNF
jgi:Tol biopolymer transport system component